MNTIERKQRPIKGKPLISTLLIVLTLVAGCVEPKTESSKPNIVLILADDLGYGDIGYNGADKIPTPVIDNLAENGMNFTNAYVASSVCSPSRYSILTGRYAWRTRLQREVLRYYDKPLIEKDETTLASLMKRNGYHTACVGKWHLGLGWEINGKAPQNPDESVFGSWDKETLNYIDFSKPIKDGPTERGFDYFYGIANSNNMQPYVYIENDKVIQAPSEAQPPYDHYINVNKAPNWDIKTVNQVLTHKAVDVINDHFKDKNDKPLFLYFPTSAIHRPCLPTFTKGKSKAGLRGDIIVELDWTVGEVVRALKENNAFDNTLLIFTSDNGPRPGDPALWLENYAKGNYENYHQDYFDEFVPEYVNENGNLIWKKGWFTYGHKSSGEYLGFKSDAWDGGFRVPFIVHWPNRTEAGKVNPSLICLSDLFATFADLMNDPITENEGIDSYSFLSNILDIKAPQIRNSMVIAGGASGAFVVIKDGWKYIEAADPDGWPETFYPNGPSYLEPQLYNLDEDKTEQNNLHDKRSQKVQELLSHIEVVKNNGKKEGSLIQ